MLSCMAAVCKAVDPRIAAMLARTSTTGGGEGRRCQAEEEENEEDEVEEEEEMSRWRVGVGGVVFGFPSRKKTWRCRVYSVRYAT